MNNLSRTKSFSLRSRFPLNIIVQLAMSSLFLRRKIFRFHIFASLLYSFSFLPTNNGRSPCPSQQTLGIWSWFIYISSWCYQSHRTGRLSLTCTTNRDLSFRWRIEWRIFRISTRRKIFVGRFVAASFIQTRSSSNNSSFVDHLARSKNHYAS